MTTNSHIIDLCSSSHDNMDVLVDTDDEKGAVESKEVGRKRLRRVTNSLDELSSDLKRVRTPRTRIAIPGHHTSRSEVVDPVGINEVEHALDTKLAPQLMPKPAPSKRPLGIDDDDDDDSLQPVFRKKSPNPGALPPSTTAATAAAAAVPKAPPTTAPLISSLSAVAKGSTGNSDAVHAQVFTRERGQFIQQSAKTISLVLPPGVEVEGWPHPDRVAAVESGAVLSPGEIHLEFLTNKRGRRQYFLPEHISREQIQFYITPFKACTGKCKKVLDSCFFGRMKNGGGFLQSQCSRCNSDRQRERKYKVDDVQELLELQGNKCLICQVAFSRPGDEDHKNGMGQNVACFDHNRNNDVTNEQGSTVLGETVGIICQSCNKAEGALRRSVKVAIAMVAYMRKKYNADGTNDEFDE